MNYFLLARPSALIVEKMKKLVKAVDATPLPIKNLDEINSQKADEVTAIVVSTALSSPVKETFTQVVDYCWKSVGKKPTFLATYADLRRTKIIAQSKFEAYGMEVTLLGLGEALDRKDEPLINPVYIITHAEIANPDSFHQSAMALKTILDKHAVVTSQPLEIK